MADGRRIHVLVLADGQPLEPGSCPACRARLTSFGCQLEAAWDVRPGARRRTRIRAVYTVECRGPVDPTTLVPCPACPMPGGADLPHG
jgi:hypothetical protein